MIKLGNKMGKRSQYRMTRFSEDDRIKEAKKRKIEEEERHREIEREKVRLLLSLILG